MLYDRIRTKVKAMLAAVGHARGERRAEKRREDRYLKERWRAANQIAIVHKRIKEEKAEAYARKMSEV